MNLKQLKDARKPKKPIDIKEVIKNFKPYLRTEPTQSWSGWSNISFANENNPQFTIYAYAREEAINFDMEWVDVDYLNYEDMLKILRNKSVKQKCQQVFDNWLEDYYNNK